MSQPVCEVWFYRLERAAVEQTLLSLLDKVGQRGWRSLVRSPSPERLARLDDWLWAYDDEAFLAHGLDGEAFAERQPILLSSGAGNTNRAQAVFLLDGAEVGALPGVERCIVLVDGRDADAVEQGRQSAEALRAAGHPVRHWRQDAAKGWRQES